MGIKKSTRIVVTNPDSFYCDYNNCLQIGFDDGSEVNIELSDAKLAEMKLTIDNRHKRNEDKRIENLKQQMEELDGRTDTDS